MEQCTVPICKNIGSGGGVNVHRCNVEPLPWLNRLYNRISYALFVRLLHRRACPTYGRSWLHRFLTRRKIKAITKAYPDVQLHLFLTYAFRNEYTDKPSVLWCDWSDAIVIERLGRKTAWYERWWLAYESKVIQKADAVYSMFPVCADKMSKMYKREVKWLRRNVVNTVETEAISLEEIIPRRLATKRILFIGGGLYKGACEQLITVFRKVRKNMDGLELHVVGQEQIAFGGDLEGVQFHGYLHKDVESEKNLYYELLKSTRVFVNSASQWGGYSSTVEAMYYGCPVVISPYEDFRAEFGPAIDFGVYLDNTLTLEKALTKVFEMSEDEYHAMCIHAHETVANYTWKNYVEHLLDDLHKRGIDV